MASLNAKIGGVKVSDIGIGLAAVGAKKVKGESKKQKQMRAIASEWGEHLAGGKLKEGEVQKLVNQWMAIPSGFASMTMQFPHWKTGAKGLIDLDDFQVQFIDDGAKYRCYRKARRIGLTLAAIIKGICNAHLDNPEGTYYISKNYEEAKEKISTYAGPLYYSMPKDLRLPLASRGKKTRLDFLSKDGQVISLVSHPQTEPRGGQGHFVLDEFACYVDQQSIYVAAQNAIMRAGSLTLLSTPRAKGDLFYKVCEGVMAAKQFQGHRFVLPWWKARICVKDGKYEQAQKMAPGMATEDRVFEFGSDKLISVFEGNLSIEMFQVEYECAYLDDAASFYSDEQLRFALFPMIDVEVQAEMLGKDAVKYPMDEKLRRLGVATGFYRSVPEVKAAFHREEIGNSLILAVDPGFTDGCSLMIGEVINGITVVRYNQKFVHVSYGKREGIIVNLIKELHINRVAIDCKDAEGRALAAKLKSLPSLAGVMVVEIKATALINSEMAIAVRTAMSQQTLAIPDYDPLIKDIKKVRTTFTRDGEPTIKVIRDKDGHGDRFYTLMYLVFAANNGAMTEYSISVNQSNVAKRRFSVVRDRRRMFGRQLPRVSSPVDMRGAPRP